jgi:3'-phosphoadenosine 5'-phosphosulfate sulfotransferase (PAPS reductase)/FAD synthetase
LELPELYEYIEKVEDYIGMEITRLKHNKTFDEYFYEVPSRGKYHELGLIRGFPPVLSGCYINRDVKVRRMQKHLKEDGAISNYIGFTADEVKRSSGKQFTSTPNRMYRFPLIEWGWGDDECLSYLASKGLPHPLQGLRSGCWLCPKQPVSSLRYIYNKHPDLWLKLRAYEKDAPAGFHPNKDLNVLAERFRNEQKQTALSDFGVKI